MQKAINPLFMEKPTKNKVSSLLVRIAIAANVAPSAREPVSPIKTRAG